MKPEDLTDKFLLDLHVQQLRAIGRSDACIKARTGTAWRVSCFLDPGRSTWLDGWNPRALIEAEPSDLVRWQASLAGLKPKSVRAYVTNLQEFFSWLVRPMRVITDSPAEDLMKPKAPRREPRPIPEADLEFALDACTDKETFAYMVLGAYAGLRSVDVSNLDKDALIPGEGVNFLRLVGKGGDEDRVAIGELVTRVVSPFLVGRGPMFTRDGQRVSARMVERTVNEYLNSIGLPHTFHMFRHRYGTQTYAITKDLLFTKQQMRHRTVTSTQIYVQVDLGVNKPAVAELDRGLSKRRRMR